MENVTPAIYKSTFLWKRECAQSSNKHEFVALTYVSKLPNVGVWFLKVWPNEAMLERETIWKTIICSDTGVTEQDVRRKEGKNESLEKN